MSDMLRRMRSETHRGDRCWWGVHCSPQRARGQRGSLQERHKGCLDGGIGRQPLDVQVACQGVDEELGLHRLDYIVSLGQCCGVCRGCLHHCLRCSDVLHSNPVSQPHAGTS